MLIAVNVGCLLNGSVTFTLPGLCSHMIENRDSLSAHLACLVDSRVLMAKKGVKAVVSHNCEFHTIKVTPPQLYSMYHSKQFLLTYDIVLLSWLFSNAIGLPSCSSTAPKPTPHASHMTSNLVRACADLATPTPVHCTEPSSPLQRPSHIFQPK